MNSVQFYRGEFDLNEILSEIDFYQYKKPLYIVNLSDIIRNYKIWQNYMPKIHPYFTVKSNDHPVILSLLNELGAGFNCMTRGELAKINEMKVESDRIVFGHPIKPITHLLHAKRYGITTTIFDRESELHKIKRYYPQSQLMLRINCCKLENTEKSPAIIINNEYFGCNPFTDGRKLLDIAKHLKLNVVGITFHVTAKQPEAIIYQKSIEISKTLFDYGRSLGFNMNVLNIGGGFSARNNFKSIIHIGRLVENVLGKYFPQNDVRVIAEPGRFLVESSHTLVCGIQSKKEILKDNDKKELIYYINDGIFGSFNRKLTEKRVFLPKYFWDEDESEVNKQIDVHKSYIIGTSSDPIDKICENIFLPNLKIGDSLIFENMGAYTLPVIRDINGLSSIRIKFYCNENDKSLNRNSLCKAKVSPYNAFLKFLS